MSAGKKITENCGLFMMMVLRMIYNDLIFYEESLLLKFDCLLVLNYYLLFLRFIGGFFLFGFFWYIYAVLVPC